MQFASDAFMHCIQLYIKDKQVKESVDEILDSCLDKQQRKISKVSPSKDSSVYSLWRISRATFSGPETYEPVRPHIRSSVDYAKGAMHEQKAMWRAQEGALIQKLAQFNSQHALNKGQQPNAQTKDILRQSKEK